MEVLERRLAELERTMAMLTVHERHDSHISQQKETKVQVRLVRRPIVALMPGCDRVSSMQGGMNNTCFLSV